MPIYEYRCEKCGKRNSLFKVSMAAAEASEGQLKCSRCGSPSLRRLLSRFAVGRTPTGTGEELYNFDRMTADLDENDPAQLDQWSQSLGGEPD